MNKTSKYARNGVIAFSLIGGWYNAITQLQRIEEGTLDKFNWRELLRNMIGWGLAGGVGGGLIGYYQDVKNLKIEPINAGPILYSAAKSVILNKESRAYQILSEKADRVEQIIRTKFKNKLGGYITRFGSSEDNTALKDHFDIDINIPFSRNSYRSTSEMMNALWTYFRYSYQDHQLIKVRKQKVSVGLVYQIGNRDLKIDLVPLKLSKHNDTKGYLNINGGWLEQDGRKMTDIKQLKSIQLRETQKKLLVSLKQWKSDYDVPIQSHLLRLLILDAYKANRGRLPYHFSDKLIMVLRFIADNIETRRIVSTENTNNVLTDIDSWSKTRIRQACERVLDDYKYQPNSIVKHFG